MPFNEGIEVEEDGLDGVKGTGFTVLLKFGDIVIVVGGNLLFYFFVHIFSFLVLKVSSSFVVDKGEQFHSFLEIVLDSDFIKAGIGESIMINSLHNLRVEKKQFFFFVRSLTLSLLLLSFLLYLL